MDCIKQTQPVEYKTMETPNDHNHHSDPSKCWSVSSNHEMSDLPTHTGKTPVSCIELLILRHHSHYC